MGDFVIHYMKGHEILDSLPNDNPWKKYAKQYKTAFGWGTQGPDVLFHDTPITSLSAKKGQLSQYGGEMHSEKTSQLFYDISQFLIENKQSEYYPALAAFVTGFICHYALDKQIHAYLLAFEDQLHGIYRTPNHTYRIHARVEIDIDSAFYAIKTGGKPIRNFKMDPGMEKDRFDINAIEMFFNDIVERTYGHHIAPGEVSRCVKLFYDKECFMFDPTGIKAGAFFTFKQLIHPGSSYTLDIRRNKVYYDCLNLNHSPWVYPHEPDKVTTKSVMDLVEDAHVDAVQMIDEFIKCVDEGKPYDHKYMRSFSANSDMKKRAAGITVL